MVVGLDELLQRARRIRSEIRQIHIDAEAWNAWHPDQEPLNGDPDGELGKLAVGLDRSIAEMEARRVAISAHIQ